jgi:hypothetical protein
MSATNCTAKSRANHMSASNTITRIAVCIRCERPYWNTGPDVCGRCEDSAKNSQPSVAKAQAARRSYGRMNSTVQGDCSGCGTFKRIDLRDRRCVDCQKERYQRNRLEVLKQKIRCKGCSEMKRRAYLNENICRRCVLTRKNEVAHCVDCGKEKLIAVKKGGPRCMRCYQNQFASQRLRKLLDNYCGPNRIYFKQLAERIDWEAVDEDMRRRFSLFVCYLENFVIPEPLTWEWLDENMPSLSGESRKRSQAIRSCLWDLAYIQVAQGKLEDRKSYLGRKRIENLIEKMPRQWRKEISDHVDWMKRKSFSPHTIYTRLINTKQFLNWGHDRGVALNEITDFLFEEFEQFYRWQWTCAECDTKAAYDVYGDTPNCFRCGVDMEKTRWHTNRAVGEMCADVQRLLRWAFEVGLAREAITTTPCHALTFRHYPEDVIKQIARYVASSTACPIEAFVLYLVIFHTCSVWELMHAQLPIDENGEVQKLSEALCIIIPEREPSRGNLSTGRVEKQIEFDPSLIEWLTPLLARVDEWRGGILKGLRNKYVLITPCGAKHQKSITYKYISNTIDRGCANAGVDHCTAKTLRLTAAAIFADAGVMGILKLMGWSKQRAHQLGWIKNREMVLPGVRKIVRRKNNMRQSPAGTLA